MTIKMKLLHFGINPFERDREEDVSFKKIIFFFTIFLERNRGLPSNDVICEVGGSELLLTHSGIRFLKRSVPFLTNRKIQCHTILTAPLIQLFLNAKSSYCLFMIHDIEKGLKTQPGFCMAMTVKLPTVPIDNDIETHDKVFNSLLVHSYHMFRLFMGSMNSALTVAEQPEGELEQLKLRATYFYSKHLQMMPLEDADLADAFLGIQFLPMDKLSFLKVRSLVSHVEQTYPCITSSTVLYQDQIVWTGLCQDDVQLIYNYLTTKLFPASTSLSSETRYLTGPSDVHNHSSEMRTPHVFLNHSQGAPDECQLVVYRVAGVTICLFVSASIELNHDFFVSLDATLGPRILALSADVAEQALLRKTPSLNIGTDSIRFLYFNQWNMAFKSTLHQSIPGHRRVLQCQPSANNDVIKTCADLCEDFSSFGEGEIVVKTKSDAWVLGKLSNQRHLYVVVTRKNAELVEICDEVRRLRNILFKDILLLE
nr:EOG090X084E [Simocephalus serrulatus]